MNLELKKILRMGPEQGSVKVLNLIVPTPLTHTSRVEKSGLSFNFPFPWTFLNQQEDHTCSWPHSSQPHRTFSLLIMTEATPLADTGQECEKQEG